MKQILVIALLMLLFKPAHTQQKAARLIVRGDDMGYAHSGNEAIIECYKNGIERSVGKARRVVDKRKSGL